MPETTDHRGEMPFLDHVEELRWRILYSLLALVVGTLIGWVVVERVDIIGLLTRPIAPLIPGGKLRVTSPTEPFFITLKFAFVLGLLIASPFVGYHAWAFLVPALYPRERRLIVPALSAGVVLFLAGATAAYLWLLPRALALLLGIQRGVFDPLITADKYFGFAAQLIIAVGVVAELPLVIVILAALGLVSRQFLVRNRRYALVVATGAAALLAPPDAVSMLLMMGLLFVLYEVGIWCAWVVERRRARRAQATAGAGGAEGGGGAASAALLAALLLAAAGPLGAQTPPVRPPVRPDTTLRTPAESAGATRGLDTAAARRLGLPTGPRRSFPPGDAVIDSLLKIKGYRVTQYLADTLIVQGGDTEMIHLRGEAYVEREGTKLESDSIRYRQRSCRLDAIGDPRLFEEATVMVGEAMRYDTCVKRGTVRKALTNVAQGSARWYVRGDLAVDSGSTRLYGAKSEITSDENPVPDYHFATGEMKWLNQDVMVARPAVLYIHDVPILWLPFIPMDVRKGRRSGVLVPRLGINDIVRPVRSYERHIANFGYYVALNDYLDALLEMDWYAERYFAVKSRVSYKWLDRFIDGSVSFDRLNQLDQPGTSLRVGWQHLQRFSSRTSFNASIDYSTNTSLIEKNTVNPFLATASLGSQVSFTKQFAWGTLNAGGNLHQEVGSGLVSQTIPTVTLSPLPIDITSWMTWSPSFSFTNQQTFHQLSTPVLLPNGALDTVFADSRASMLSFGTPLRLGRWNWTNSFAMADNISNARAEFDILDATVAGGLRRVLFNQTFSTTVDWQTAINLPLVFGGTWKVQPGIGIVNKTSAGPFMIRNQFTNGEFVEQGKRLQFSLGMAPTFFGFFPGFGPIARIRHSFSPLISYAYAPGATVDSVYRHAIDPQQRLLNSGSDPQQTISVGLSQNFEAKLKAHGSDSTRAPRKIRLLSINTSAISYNFEQAKQQYRTGWQTTSISNTFASDLLPFSLTTTHDLWLGQAGTDSARFDPFLTSMSTNFTITPATIHGIAALLGLARKGGPAPGAPPAAADTQPGQGAPPTGSYGQKGLVGAGGIPLSSVGKGFNLSVAYNLSRTRPVVDTTVISGTGGGVGAGGGGHRTATFDLSFQPTRHWSARWSSNYDFDLQQFGAHSISLERDLHRWHASFSFLKAPNGNLAFSVYVALLDQPDIKFDYEQRSFSQ